MQCKEWDDANSELFKESHDEAVHKNSYKSRLYELISASLGRDRNRDLGGAFPYSRRGLRLRRRGAYSPVLTHGLRVVSPQGKRLTMICASLVLLQIMFAVHR